MSLTLYIDVREADEYHAHHIPNSINIPLTKLHHLQIRQSRQNGKSLF